MDPTLLLPWLAVVAVVTRELMWITAAGILLSNLDDLAADGVWLALLPPLRRQPVPADPAPLRHAVLIPAWDESAVIGRMLARFLATQAHGGYRLFVGVYPNDPATLAAVRAVDDGRVEMVVLPHAGPTTKADCLNHLWSAVLACETRQGARFDSLILHDSEDVVHARELALFDAMLPQLAMVQVPVLPIPDKKSRWISGHYLDEFAQNHIRDMMIRAPMGAAVPSAGVGTAICRDAMDGLAADGPPFDASSLTEDYEIGHKLHGMGLPAAMVRHRAPDADGRMRLVAVREYFPATFADAVRQKSRWLTGISLSGWDRLGWSGTAAARWMLLRDRKGLFTSALAIIAYGLLALLAAQWAVRGLIAEQLGTPLPPLVIGVDPWLTLILAVNAALLGWRLLWRAIWTGAAHGPVEALRSVLRAPVTNAVNAVAGWRAVQRYRTALEEGRRIGWDKTAHRFPDSMEAAHG